MVGRDQAARQVLSPRLLSAIRYCVNQPENNLKPAVYARIEQKMLDDLSSSNDEEETIDDIKGLSADNQEVLDVLTSQHDAEIIYDDKVEHVLNAESFE